MIDGSDFIYLTFQSSSIFAGVLVTLALVMISTINTTRARAGFDSQAESLILFARFARFPLPLSTTFFYLPPFWHRGIFIQSLSQYDEAEPFRHEHLLCDPAKGTLRTSV